MSRTDYDELPDPEDCSCQQRQLHRSDSPKDQADRCDGTGHQSQSGTHDHDSKCDKYYEPQINQPGFIDGVRHRCGSDCAQLHTRKPWVRRGIFPFLDLPFEIRASIYELLLIRGHVAVAGSDRPISSRYGFSHWCHKPLKWSLLRINQQIRTEAMEVLCSEKNTCYLGPGPVPLENDSASQFLPSFKRLDCALDFRDGDSNAGIFFRACRDQHADGDDLTSEYEAHFDDNDMLVEDAVVGSRLEEIAGNELVAEFDSRPQSEKWAVVHKKVTLRLLHRWIIRLEACLY